MIKEMETINFERKDQNRGAKCKRTRHFPLFYQMSLALFMNESNKSVWEEKNWQLLSLVFIENLFDDHANYDKFIKY